MARLGVVRGQNRVSFLRLIRLLGFPLQCQPLNHLKSRFLVPVGPCGDWEGTAQGIGEAPRKTDRTADVSF